MSVRTEPRYIQVGDELRERIEAGAYPVGAFLPPELELCEEFGISRHTAREALRRLTDAGYIQRRQGSGSQVVADHAPAAYVHSMRSLGELFQYAADTEFRVGSVALRRPDGEFAEDLGGAAQEDWLITEGLRSEPATSRPICFSHVFVHRRFAEIGPDLPHLKGAIYAHVEDRFGVEVAEVEQAIRVVPMPAHAAHALHERRGAPAARVRRRYTDGDGHLLLASVNFHCSDSFNYSMRLRREGSRGSWG
jgi:DNA-binding GntR family transcriptional regulator